MLTFLASVGLWLCPKSSESLVWQPSLGAFQSHHLLMEGLSAPGVCLSVLRLAAVLPSSPAGGLRLNSLWEVPFCPRSAHIPAPMSAIFRHLCHLGVAPASSFLIESLVLEVERDFLLTPLHMSQETLGPIHTFSKPSGLFL